MACVHMEPDPEHVQRHTREMNESFLTNRARSFHSLVLKIPGPSGPCSAFLSPLGGASAPNSDPEPNQRVCLA